MSLGSLIFAITIAVLTGGALVAYNWIGARAQRNGTTPRREFRKLFSVWTGP